MFLEFAHGAGLRMEFDRHGKLLALRLQRGQSLLERIELADFTSDPQSALVRLAEGLHSLLGNHFSATCREATEFLIPFPNGSLAFLHGARTVCVRSELAPPETWDSDSFRVSPARVLQEILVAVSFLL